MKIFVLLFSLFAFSCCGQKSEINKSVKKQAASERINASQSGSAEVLKDLE